VKGGTPGPTETVNRTGKLANTADNAAYREATRITTAKIRALPKPSDEDVTRYQTVAQTSRTQGRAGGDDRGSAAARRARKIALFNEYGGKKRGYCPCGHCGRKLHHTADTNTNPNGYALVTADKLLPRKTGGSYKQGNVIPACLGCNQSRGDRPHKFGNPPWGDPYKNAARVARKNGQPDEADTILKTAATGPFTPALHHRS
jgi:hypothetical protein